jgi:hypothetical protein
MKLRNKKTGEIIIPTDYTFATYDDGIKYGHHIYYSLAEFNEDWEDYKPAEPLIKDEKVRKAVRAWADANVHTLIQYNIAKDCLYFLSGTDYSDTSISISFDEVDVFKELEHRRTYTLAELCGEEE